MQNADSTIKNNAEWGFNHHKTVNNKDLTMENYEPWRI